MLLQLSLYDKQRSILHVRAVNAGSGRVGKELHKSSLQQNWFAELRHLYDSVKLRVVIPAEFTNI